MKKINLALLSIFMSFSLLGCEKGEKVEKKSNESAKVASDVNISEEDYVKKLMIEQIKNKLASGELKKEDLTDEKMKEIYNAVSIIAQSLKNARNNNDERMINILSELNKIEEIKPKLNKNLPINEYSNEDSKKVGELIMKKVPNTVVNTVRQYLDTNLFEVYVNHSTATLFTNRNIDYFFMRVNTPGMNYVLDEKGEPIDDAEKLIKAYKQVLNDLDKTKLIQMKYGTGEKELFIFTDIDCPFCKKTEEVILNNFTEKDNVTIYFVMFPISELHPQALEKSAKILCSPDRNKAWLDYRKKGIVPEIPNFNKEKCEDEVDKQRIFPQVIGFNSTPSFINGNGFIYQNGIPENLKADDIREIINIK